ncbi:exoribonuclease R [Vibrio sp. TRT 21S02]|uniref:exoribonuclease R n=1 Tax=Vibrio sp. TRT 21S02 TaxID=3418507 RepID=UPI003CF9B98A
MERDYTYASLKQASPEELETLSMRLIHRLLPEESMSELFTFEQEEVANEERYQAAQFDAMLRMTAIALGEVPALFSGSENAQQNTLRMTRLLLWHFYAVSFHLANTIPLETHCNHVEFIIKKAPKDAFAWTKELTELLHQYAKIHEQQNDASQK